MSAYSYLVALGSNMRVPGIGGPRIVIEAAYDALDRRDATVVAKSSIMESAPIGPSARRYANGAAIVETRLEPTALLAFLHEIEVHFGRRRRGQIWRERPLDCDIIVWSGGIYASPRLSIPHPHFREREFVLGPACEIAGDWRDPVTGLTMRHLHARLTKRHAAPR